MNAEQIKKIIIFAVISNVFICSSIAMEKTSEESEYRYIISGKNENKAEKLRCLPRAQSNSEEVAIRESDSEHSIGTQKLKAQNRKEILKNLREKMLETRELIQNSENEQEILKSLKTRISNALQICAETRNDSRIEPREVDRIVASETVVAYASYTSAVKRLKETKIDDELRADIIRLFGTM